MAKKSTFKSNWQKYLLQWGTLAALIFFVSGLATLLFPKMESPIPRGTVLSGALRPSPPTLPTTPFLVL